MIQIVPFISIKEGIDHLVSSHAYPETFREKFALSGERGVRALSNEHQGAHNIDNTVGRVSHMHTMVNR